MGQSLFSVATVLTIKVRVATEETPEVEVEADTETREAETDEETEVKDGTTVKCTLQTATNVATTVKYLSAQAEGNPSSAAIVLKKMETEEIIEQEEETSNLRALISKKSWTK
jgi:hypothetical protein